MSSPFGFVAEYLEPSPAYDEFETFLRLEFAHEPRGWDPLFGKVARQDGHPSRWDYAFLLAGEVPDADSEADAQRKVRDLTAGLRASFRKAHANPGDTLPVPRIKVWRWAD
jgi:hypothetical protein